MKKSKRIMALIGAILLVLLYVSTLIFAFIDSVVSLPMEQTSGYAVPQLSVERLIL